MSSHKRPYSSGSVREYQTKAGKHYRVSLPASTLGGKRKFRTFPTKEEAEEQLARASAAVAAGDVVPSGRVTLGSYGERWLSRLQHRTAEDDRSRWHRFLEKRPIAERPIKEVKTQHIKQLIESVARTRKLDPSGGHDVRKRAVSNEFVSAQTVRHVFGLLRRCFQEAIIDGHIERNPCGGYRLPANSEKHEAPNFLSLEEIEAIISSSITEKYRLIYVVAIYTGMREGELWGLRWQDLQLDIKQPLCIVRHSYNGPTKNNKTRKFHLLPKAAAALKKWREMAKQTKPSDLVFPGRGGRTHAKGYDGDWTRQRLKIGIRPEVRFHDFRHTCASHLVMGSWGLRWSLIDVCRYLGHSSVSVTQRYAHLSSSYLADMAAQTTG